MARILLFTGKGGVGKTTMAAATALCAAERGYKTVILSTDAAHSLADSLDKPLGPEPVEVVDNLWAQESDILHNIQKHWGTVHRWLVALMAWRGLDDIIAEEIAVLPGMDELASLIWVYQHERSEQYDVIVVDCAPTGEALRLLTFPEVAQWWIHKLLPLGKRLNPVVAPIVHRVSGMPMPGNEIFDAADELLYQLEALRSLLTDRKRTSIRIVLNPEKMVVKEAQRTYTYLNLYNYPVDSVICNRLIPDATDGRYWEQWKKTQARHLKLIEECFSPLPILKVPLLEDEVVGMGALQEIAHFLYPRGDPIEVLFEGKAMSIERDNGDYVLTLRLPLVSKADIAVLRSGEELIVQVGNQRRNILLPHALGGREPKGAKLEGGELRIRFSAPDSAP
ncbi:MAG: ArsA family ATPase [Dehalococcoidia bacterium]|nr:ArsA family ATPase [Dehalococcoidia bacterium]